ncbi:MAG TPA: alpha/beta hydrolase, partial [Candidatus Saccharimonadia bacterium]|nr:alpha/beta hydrolase [Candidatus Saccharimonadia bacterium]
DFAQVMRDTIYALFDGPYLTLGMNAKRLKGMRTPTLIMSGNNDIHPRRVAEQVHRLIPNAHWAAVRPHTEEPDKYVHRVLQFLSEVEARV